MKIAMVGLKGIPYIGGVEDFTEQIGRRLVERGHRVLVYCRPYVDTTSPYMGMEIRHLPSINTKHLDALTHTAIAAACVTFTDVDVVHFHALGPSVFSWIPRTTGKPTIAHVHGLDWQRAKWGKVASACLRGGEFAAARFPTCTVAISRHLQSYFEAKYGRKVEWVPTGFDAPPPRPPDQIMKWGLGTNNYILFLARLVPEKGCHYLIQAYEQLNPDVKLVIAGPLVHGDPYIASLRRPHNPNIIFTDGVSGSLLEELYSNAYLYVLPSEIEGLPKTVIEALGFGRHVLASNIAANLEAMGEHGTAFESRNTADLRAKLAALLADRQLYAPMQHRATEWVKQQYSWEATVDRLERIYTDCINAKSMITPRSHL